MRYELSFHRREDTIKSTLVQTDPEKFGHDRNSSSTVLNHRISNVYDTVPVGSERYAA
jgi:hypothetical protein